MMAIATAQQEVMLMSTAHWKATTLRLPPEEAAILKATAEVNGKTIADEVRDAIQARINLLRADLKFQARLKQHLEENEAVLRRLADE
jgi:predicted DNA-binding protein